MDAIRKYALQTAVELTKAGVNLHVGTTQWNVVQVAKWLEDYLRSPVSKPAPKPVTKKK